MAMRFDERALSLIKGEVKENLAAWGSYPLILSLFYKILDAFGLLQYRIAVIFWLNQFFGYTTAYIAYRFMRQKEVPKNYSYLILGLFFFFNPMQIYINSMNISESLFQLTSLIFVILAVNTTTFRPWIHWSLFAVALALSVILRNIIIPFSLIVVFLIPFFAEEKRKLFITPAFLMGCLLTLAIIWGAGQINSHFDALKSSTLSSNRGANIGQTWCEAPTLHFKTSENSFWYSPPAFWRLPETRSLFVETDFADSFYYSNLALGCLKENPSLIFLRLRSVLNIFDGPFYPDPLEGRLKQVHQGWGGLSLALFLFCMLGLILVRRTPLMWLMSLFIAGQLAAVYLANAGEGRMLYSFIFVMIVLSGLVWKDLKNKVLIVILTLISAVALLCIPPLDKIMETRERDSYFLKDHTERLKTVQGALANAPKVTSDLICNNVFKEASECLMLGQVGCNQEKQQKVRSAIAQFAVGSITEVQLFCLNYGMARLQAEGIMQFTAQEIQAPSPLPGGPDAGNHPVVGMAAQLLQVKLLTQIGREDLIPQGENSEELLYQLLRYQHRVQRNRPEYRGAIATILNKKDISPEAAWVFTETLKLWLKFEDKIKK